MSTDGVHHHHHHPHHHHHHHQSHLAAHPMSTAALVGQPPPHLTSHPALAVPGLLHTMPHFSTEGPIDLRVSPVVPKSSPDSAPTLLAPLHDSLPQPSFLHSLIAAEQFHENPVTSRVIAAAATASQMASQRGPEPSAFRIPYPRPLGESLQEISARILFSIVNWIKHIPSFRTLPARDQIILLEESWRDLFLLSLAQWDIPLDVHHILECANVTKDNLPSDKMAAVLSDIRYIRDLVLRFRELTVDRTEYACLKAIVLFRAELFGLRDTQMVEVLQDQAQVLLGEYERHQYGRQPTRFGKLLLLLPCLRVIAAPIIARLFFKETVGNIPVERLLCDIYQSEKMQ